MWSPLSSPGHPTGSGAGLAAMPAGRLRRGQRRLGRDWAAPPLLAAMEKLTPGMGYHEESARDARGRIIAFFDAHLKT